jgi:ABC-type branched-subunit amino acid transport system substrate-binding protein
MGQLQSPALRAMVAEMGGEYGEAMLDPASIDYRGAIARARETNPEVLMITGQGSTAESVVVKQAREMGMTTPVWAFSAAYQGKAFRDALGPYGEGMVMGGIYLDPNDPVTKPFAKSYRAELGYIPGYPVGEFYDDVKILAHVIGTVGYDAEAIRAALTTLKGVPSVLGGTITMGPDHYTRFSNLGLWKVKAGKLVRLT